MIRLKNNSISPQNSCESIELVNSIKTNNAHNNNNLATATTNNHHDNNDIVEYIDLEAGGGKTEEHRSASFIGGGSGNNDDTYDQTQEHCYSGKVLPTTTESTKSSPMMSFYDQSISPPSPTTSKNMIGTTTTTTITATTGDRSKHEDQQEGTFQSLMKDYFYLKVFSAWFIWIFSATVVYAFRNDLGWAKGFYMAVNVGYSIGWGYPLEKDHRIIWYSIFHVLVGASAVAAALGFFARSVVSTSKEWYHVALLEEQEKIAQGNRWMKVWLWIKRNKDSLKIIALWMIWISCMTAYTCNRVGWKFPEGLYNAISSLSTGGLWAIPKDSADIDYFAVGLFSATGVPLMALAMSTIAQLCLQFQDPEGPKKRIRAKVTAQELEMMQKFGLDDGDGFINRSEFILLCAVRLGAMDQELIKAINDRFCELDTSGDGCLEYKELLEESVVVIPKQTV